MKRITTEFSKNFRASLRIRTPSPATVEDVLSQDDVTPTLRGMLVQSSARQDSSQSHRSSTSNFDDLVPLSPLPFQVRSQTPSFMVVTPAHLRRPGPHSPDIHWPLDPPSLPIPRTANETVNTKYETVNTKYETLNTKYETVNTKYETVNTKYEITVAVRVVQTSTSTRWASSSPAESSRSCVLIERPGSRKSIQPGALGNEAVSARQQQTLALLNKLEKKGGENTSKDIEEGDNKPKLFVTVPQFAQGAISATTTTRKFSRFDFIFDDASNQVDVYNDVSFLLDQMLSENSSSKTNTKNNLTIVACGHPKSNNSYTLFGPTNNVTLSPGQRKPPPVPVKRGDSQTSTRFLEPESLERSDGLLQRFMAKIIASSEGAVSMSYAELMPTATLPGGIRGAEEVIDLLTGEAKYETDRGTFWESLAKAPVSSLQDVSRRLRDGRRFTNDGGHVIVAIEFLTKYASPRRLVFIDISNIEPQMVATPLSGVFASQRSTPAVGSPPLETLLKDSRFKAERMLLIATISQRTDDATVTLATLTAADEFVGAKKLKGRRSPKLQLAPLQTALQTQSEPRQVFGSDAFALTTPKAVQEDTRFSDSSTRVSNLQSQLREERETNRTLCQKLESASEGLVLAQQELASARLRERDLILDASATRGTLMALAREHDFEQNAFLEAKAAAAESKKRWTSAIEECKFLREVIFGLTAHTQIGLDGRLSKAAGGPEGEFERKVADSLASLASRCAEAHTAAEQFRRDLEEREMQLDKLSRMLVRERRICTKLRVKLGDGARDISDDEENLSPDWKTFEIASKRALSASGPANSPPSTAQRNSRYLPSKKLPLDYMQSPMLASPILQNLESQVAGGGGARREASTPGVASAAAEAEWEAFVHKLEHENHEFKVAEGEKGQDSDTPADLQSEAEWEAMISLFEQEERRRKPAIRHRIHIAKIKDMAY